MADAAWPLLHAEAAFPSFYNLVPNASFELDDDADGIPDSWRREPPAEFSFSKPIAPKGRAGRKSLFINAGESASWETEIKGVRPNRYYLLSFRVKREGWRDGEYPTLKIFGQEIRMNELFSWGGWRKVTYLLNSGARHKTTLAFLSRRLSHKISFSNVSLREFRFKFLAPSGGKIVRGGRPRFSWRIPSNNLVFRIVIDLFDNSSFIDLTSSKETRIELMSPQGSALQIQKALPDGTWHWRIRAFLGRDEVTRSAFQRFRVAGGGRSPAALPSRVRLYSFPPPLNFFPIGMFGARLEGFEELKEAGFNSILIGYDPKTIESAERHGLKAIVDHRKRNDPTFGPLARRASLSPALLGWYIEDEAEGRGVSPAAIWRKTALIRKFSPSHLTSLALLRSNLARYYGMAVDVVMVDPYPIPTQPLTWVSDSIKEVHRQLGPQKPVWAIIQAFNWSSVPHYPKDKAGRFPTLPEERAMAFLAIVHGARGIFFFAEQLAKKDPKHWNNLKKLAGELRCLYPLLLSTGKAPQPILTSLDRDSKGKPVIHYLAKKLERKSVALPDFGCPSLEKGNYLIAVNTRKKPTAMRLRGLEPQEGSAVDLLTSSKLKFHGGELRDNLEPYGVRIWRLDKSR